jgi:hypothetical protein
MFIAKRYDDFDSLLSDIKKISFPMYDDAFITNYISGRRSTLNFVKQETASELMSEVSTIVSNGETIPMIKAIEFDVKTVAISLRKMNICFSKLEIFNTREWFGGSADDYARFVDSQVENLDMLRKMFYGICQNHVMPESQFQTLIQLFLFALLRTCQMIPQLRFMMREANVWLVKFSLMVSKRDWWGAVMFSSCL